MQRAAASAQSSPSTPNKHDSPSTPDTDERSRPSKRARTSLDSSYSNGSPRGGNAELESALAAEEARKALALERVAAEKGETKWALSVAGVLPKREGGEVLEGVSLGMIERMDQEEGLGRRRFGAVKGRRKEEKDKDSEEESSEDEDVEDLIEKGRKEARRLERKGGMNGGDMKRSSRDGSTNGSRNGGGLGNQRGKKRKSAG